MSLLQYHLRKYLLLFPKNSHLSNADKYNRLTCGELLSNDGRAVGFGNWHWALGMLALGCAGQAMVRVGGRVVRAGRVGTNH